MLPRGSSPASSGRPRRPLLSSLRRAPAQVAKKAVEALVLGDRITKEDVPLLTSAMLGVIRGFAARGSRRRPLVRGLRFDAAAAEAWARF
jgi:hypothetical protein